MESQATCRGKEGESTVTEEEYQGARPVIEMAQRLHGSLQTKLAEHGVQPIDVLIASTFAAHNLASALHGNPIAAIEWMRDALDTIERQIMTGGTAH